MIVKMAVLEKDAGMGEKITGAAKAVGEFAKRQGSHVNEADKKVSGMLNKLVGLKEGPEKSKILNYLKNHSASSSAGALAAAGGGGVAYARRKKK